MDLCVKVEGMRVCFELKCAGLWQAAIHHKQFLCSAVPLEQKKKEKVLQAVYAAYGRDGSFTQVSFCIFQTLGPNLYATLLYIEIHCLVGNTIYFCTDMNLFYRKILYINGTMKYATFHKRILSKNIIRTYVVRKKIVFIKSSNRSRPKFCRLILDSING